MSTVFEASYDELKRLEAEIERLRLLVRDTLKNCDIKPRNQTGADAHRLLWGEVIVAEQTTIVLGKEDSEAFVKALTDPPEPNEKLKELLRDADFTKHACGWCGANPCQCKHGG